MKWIIGILILLVMIAAIGVFYVQEQSVEYFVGSESDVFTQHFHGRTIAYSNWTINVDGQEIDVPKGDATIKITQKGRKLNVLVNNRLVLDE